MTAALPIEGESGMLDCLTSWGHGVDSNDVGDEGPCFERWWTSKVKGTDVEVTMIRSYEAVPDRGDEWHINGRIFWTIDSNPDWRGEADAEDFNESMPRFEGDEDDAVREAIAMRLPSEPFDVAPLYIERELQSRAECARVGVSYSNVRAREMLGDEISELRPDDPRVRLALQVHPNS